MIKIRQNTALGLRNASWIPLLCAIFASFAIAAEPRPAKVAIVERTNTGLAHLMTKAGLRGDREGRAGSTPRNFQNIHAQGGHAGVGDVRFTHVTTSDGLSQSSVTAILQDRRGFMWFGTRDGLNRYDGNDFVVYKNKAETPESLSANLITDLMEDEQGHLWIATYTGGVNKFDPATERFTRYRHDPTNPNSLVSDSVNSIARDRHGFLWFGTEASGLDKFDPSNGTFTHYRNDSDGQFVDRITKVIEGRKGDIWFVGRRGLFHLNPKTGQITRPFPTRNVGADYVYEDGAGNLWMLAYLPITGLIKYDPQAERLAKYPVGARAVGLVNSKPLVDGQKGFWVPSSLGLYYFDRRTEQFTRLFQHVDSDPDSLSDNAIVSICQDRGGVLWVGTENGGLNILNFQQEQFGRHVHRPGDPNSLSPGKVTSIYEDSKGILWLGFFPRALDRLDLKTGKITHYVRGLEDRNAISKGTDVNSIYKDARGYLWLGGWGSGVDRFDERTGRFKHYRHNPDDPNSLTSDHVIRIYGDRSAQLWVGHIDGVTRLDPANEQFTYYRPDPRNPTSYGKAASGFYQDRFGVLWISRGEGVLSRYDDRTKTFVNYTPDPHDPHKLQGGDITAMLEDRAGTLWLGALDGLYRFNRQNETFTRYTESQGLPSSAIQGILEDKAGRLWLSTKKGLSRFDPQTGTFRSYDVSDGLQADEFSGGSYTKGPDGEMFFGGSHGFNAFFPEGIRDSPYVPPVVVTSFKIFNKPVSIGAKSVLEKAIPYADSLTLSYRDNVFSFEFAALSYANSQKNRYRYRLEPLEPGWNEVGSNQRLATYTNLDPGKYVFRVQGSNSDGVWNEEGVSLPILITPPRWKTNWFRALCAVVLLALLWAAYQFRVHQLQTKSKQLREVIDTIPGYVWSALPDGSLDFINRRWLEFSGVSLEGGLGWGWEAAVHPDDLARFVDEWRAAVACGKPMETEARVRRADGQYRWLLIRNVPLRDQAGEIVKWYGTSADIDDRKRAEETLREQANLLDLTHDTIFVADMQGVIKYWNRGAEEQYGWTAEQAVGTVVYELLKTVFPKPREEVIAEVTRAGRWEGELLHTRKDGTRIVVACRLALQCDEQGAPVAILESNNDITDRKRAEEERERLRQLEADLAHINRVSMLGELAASIAHEVNQPLAGVVSNGSACLRWLAAAVPNLEEARENARRIVRDGKRAGEVIARLRALAKRAATSRERLDLNETIQDVLALVADEAKKESVIVQTQFADDLSPVSADRVQLQQVMLNLLMNAIEAMSSVGDRARELVITTRNIDPDQVQVTVEDSGIGIDAQTIDKIFDSFYTTKPGGMGMGLSISSSILQAHGGRLWATAKDGTGASFHFTLSTHHEEGSPESRD
ncbi:MAG TPA: two-component regulator propeller domain-containing protein [Terriglobia bacterium]|nr:two-component regulator propeller domain-containing protein [Terriglobia bacterium]